MLEVRWARALTPTLVQHWTRRQSHRLIGKGPALAARRGIEFSRISLWESVPATHIAAEPDLILLSLICPWSTRCEV